MRFQSQLVCTVSFGLVALTIVSKPKQREPKSSVTKHARVARGRYKEETRTSTLRTLRNKEVSQVKPDLFNVGGKWKQVKVQLGLISPARLAMSNNYAVPEPPTSAYAKSSFAQIPILPEVFRRWMPPAILQSCAGGCKDRSAAVLGTGHSDAPVPVELPCDQKLSATTKGGKPLKKHLQDFVSTHVAPIKHSFKQWFPNVKLCPIPIHFLKREYVFLHFFS